MKRWRYSRSSELAPTIATVDNVNEDGLAVWEDFLRYHATVTDALAEELERDAELPLAWYDVLIQLNNARDGRLRMQDLASAIVLSKSGLTRLVDRMERAGLVARETCPSDRRGTFAQLTPAGRKRFRAAAPGHVRAVAQHFTAHLSDQQLAVMGDAFKALLAAHRVTGLGPGCAGADTSDALPVPSA